MVSRIAASFQDLLMLGSAHMPPKISYFGNSPVPCNEVEGVRQPYPDAILRSVLEIC